LLFCSSFPFKYTLIQFVGTGKEKRRRRRFGCAVTAILAEK
jgi:hypothetical protein